MVSIAKDYRLLLLCLAVFSAPFYNFRIVGSAYVFDVVLLLSLFSVMSIKVRDESIAILCGFVLLSAASEFNGVVLGYSSEEAVFDSINILARYLLLLFIIPHLSYQVFYAEGFSVDKINIFYRSLTIGFLCVLCINVYAIQYSIEEYFLYGRFCSVYGNPNTAALIFNLMSIPFIYQLKREIFVVRCVAAIALLLTCYSLAFTGSFSGMIIQTLLFLFFLIRRFGFTLSFLGVFAASTLVSLEFIFESNFSEDSRGILRFIQFWELMSSSDEASFGGLGSASERLTSIYAGLNALIDEPLFFIWGVGFGGVENLVYTLTGHHASIHLSYLQLTVSIGLLGAFIYFYILVRTMAMARYVDKALDIDSQMSVTLVVFLGVGLFIPHTYMGFYYAPLIPVLGAYWLKK